jgi:DNA polymerase-3 subunit epsilon
VFRLRSPPWSSVAWWALDLETGGLDPKVDPIVAVGMVPIRGGVVELGEAWRTLVRPAEGSRLRPGSIEAHQLVHGDLAAAPPLAEVLGEVDRRLREGALLVHHRGVDVPFLRRGYARVGRRWPAPDVVDTAELLVRIARFAQPGLPLDAIALNLSDARRRWGLPAYQAHDALSDALATAELFLVLRDAIGARTVRDLR